MTVAAEWHSKQNSFRPSKLDHDYTLEDSQADSERIPHLLSAFGLVWAMSMLVHVANFPHWLETIQGNALVVAAFFLLTKPSSLMRLAVALTIEASVIVDQMPLMGNHLYFVLLVDLTFLFTIVAEAVRTRDNINRSQWVLVRAAPIVCLLQILLYLLAGFHKLNRDYFNTEYSCALELYNQLGQVIPSPHVEGAWAWFVIVGSVVVELAIPLFLISRRTRRATILFGMLFHLYLSFHPSLGSRGLSAFSATMFATYVLYDPNRWSVMFRRTSKWCSRRVPVRLVAFVRNLFGSALPLILSSGCLIAHQYLLKGVPREYYIQKAGFLIWVLLGISAIACYVASLFIVREQTKRVRARRERLCRPLLVFPILIVVIGLSPYLGLSTEGTFSMYSNLRVETDTNHWIMPPSFRAFPIGQNLVEVTGSSHPKLQGHADKGELINEMEFRRIMQDADNGFFALVSVNGVIQRVDRKVFSDHPLLRPLHPIQRKLLRFRPADAHGPMKCRH